TSLLIQVRVGSAQGTGGEVAKAACAHEMLQASGPGLPLAGSFTLASFGRHLAEHSLFPQPPQREVSVRYRTWAYESAALDLALRQAALPLHSVLEREPQPVRFVVSMRLGEPPSAE